MPGRDARSSAEGALRLTGLGAWTVLLAAALAVGAFVLLPRPSARRAWRRALARRWARGACRLLGVRVDESGRRPPRAALIATNHLGYLDIPVLLASTGAVFVAKREVAGWPVIGLLARAAGTIFIDRSRPRDAVTAGGRIRRALEHGETVVVFPEGTSSDGSTVLPLRSALLAPAARAGGAVYCAALAYGTPAGASPARTAVCWWGDMTFGSHLRALARLPRITARVAWSDTPVTEPDRKTLAARVHDRLLALHAPPPEMAWQTT